MPDNTPSPVLTALEELAPIALEFVQGERAVATDPRAKLVLAVVAYALGKVPAPAHMAS